MCMGFANAQGWVKTKVEFFKVLFLSPIRAAETVECVLKYVDGISQNLQSLSPYYLALPTVFFFLADFR